MPVFLPPPPQFQPCRPHQFGEDVTADGVDRVPEPGGGRGQISYEDE